MFWLTALIVKKSQILAGIYFIFLKKYPSEKIGKSSYQVKQILALFCKSVSLTLG